MQRLQHAIKIRFQQLSRKKKFRQILGHQVAWSTYLSDKYNVQQTAVRLFYFITSVFHHLKDTTRSHSLGGMLYVYVIIKISLPYMLGAITKNIKYAYL